MEPLKNKGLFPDLVVLAEGKLSKSPEEKVQKTSPCRLTKDIFPSEKRLFCP